MTQRFTDHEITETMFSHGGGFIRGLAGLFRSADDVNRAKLKATFADYWQQYDEMTLLVLQRAGKVAR